MICKENSKTNTSKKNSSKRQASKSDQNKDEDIRNLDIAMDSSGRFSGRMHRFGIPTKIWIGFDHDKLDFYVYGAESFDCACHQCPEI